MATLRFQETRARLDAFIAEFKGQMSKEPKFIGLKDRKRKLEKERDRQNDNVELYKLSREFARLNQALNRTSMNLPRMLAESLNRHFFSISQEVQQRLFESEAVSRPVFGNVI